MENKDKENIKKERDSIARDPKYKDISYRDKISTIEIDGSKTCIYSKIPKGKYTIRRNIVGIILLVLLFALPTIKIDGDPIVMLNFIERKFIIFGVIFWPQDTFIMLLMMLSFLLFIILFTVTFGRIFCGWACPQTIFLEIVFRRIESWFEGSPANQRKLKEAPWNFNKIIIKTSKWIVFYILGFSFVNAILWYFMSFDKWLVYANEPNKHISGIILIFIFTTVFFIIYNWFREQICVIVCPYGRMQSVLVDRSTILVNYDYLRGEPRGGKKNEENGDCIDCLACVNVCPTGIDIRNGIQLECVNCTACIDACDSVMKRMNKPTGLIRYASENEIVSGVKSKITVRIIAYSLVLMTLLSFFVAILATRPEVDATILRTPGLFYQEIGKDSISNLYNIKIVNKTRKEKIINIKLYSEKGNIEIIGGNIKVPSEGSAADIFFIKMAKKDIIEIHHKIKLDIISNEKVISDTKVLFISPK